MKINDDEVLYDYIEYLRYATALKYCPECHKTINEIFGLVSDNENQHKAV